MIPAPQGTRICIAATFTAEPLKPVIDFWARQLKQAFEVRFAPYNQVEQALLDEGGEFAANTAGVNIVAIRIEDFAQLGEYDMARIHSNAGHLVDALRSAHSRAPSIVCLCPPSQAFQADPARMAAAQEIAARIAPSLHYDEIAALYPVEDYEAAGGGQLGHVPYTEMYYAALGTALVRRVHALTRPPFKVIALDCDNTLWAGICGEDGPTGVAPRRQLQEFMSQQRSAGMLLALASKNNESDVLEVFDRLPDMPLQITDFAARRIDWQSKADNLAAMAGELNVGLDSFIFVDDNPKECAEVETSAPEVLTVPLPESAGEIGHFLQHVWAFDHPAITDEDRKRSVYHEQAQRFGAEIRRTSSLEQFMASLQLEVRIERVTPERLPRIAQLTQRTNQFNFTAVRRTEAELQHLLNAGGRDCFAVEVSDRFGDYGIVGAMIVEPSEAGLAINTFLLSCRALGRGVEHRMMAFLAGLRPGIIVARLKPTPQNAPARQFLESIGDPRPQSNGELVFQFPAESLRGLEWKSAPAAANQTTPTITTDSRAPRPDYARIANTLSTPVQILREMRQIRNVTGASTATEQRLGEIWADLLHTASISASDNFFDLGGHSLLAVLLLVRIHETFGVELSIDDVYSGAVTLSDLAHRIEVRQLGGPGAPEYSDLLREIEAMSDEEARRILAEGEPESRRS